MLLDLAIQAAGAIPVPVGTVAPGDVAPNDVDGWAERPDALDLERRSPRGPGEPEWPEIAAPGVAVRTEAGELQEIPTAELIEAAGELAARMATAPTAGNIWVSARPLDDPMERLLMAWALPTGAAVVLEPRPGSLVPTAAWARPTVFAGDAAEIDALVAAAETYRSPFPRRWLRRLRRSSAPVPPFDRLRTVVLCHDRRLSEPAFAFLRERGVRILRLSFDPRSTADAATWRTSYNIEALGDDTLGGDT